MYYRSQRFQKRITAGRFTLPAVILISAACWLLSDSLCSADAAKLYPDITSHLPFAQIPVWVQRLSGGLLYGLIGYFLVVLNNAFAIIRMRASVQTSVFFLFVAVCPALHTLHAGVVAAAFMLVALFFLFDSYQRSVSASHIFHAFLFLSLGSMVLPPLLYLAPVFWIGAYMMQSLTPRSLVASLVGWAVPYWFLFVYAYLTDSLSLFAAPFAALPLPSALGVRFDTCQWALLLYLLLLFVVSAGHSLVAAYDDKIRTRSYLRFLTLLVLFTFICLFLFPQLYVQLLPLLLIPLSVLIGHLFVLTASRVSNLFFIASLLLLGGIFVLNLLTPYLL